MTAFGVFDALSLQPPPDTWAAFSLSVTASWMRSWLTSGCAFETLLLLTGPAEHYSVSRTVLLVALNATYILASTSWLFHLAFAAVCWPLIVITCIVQYAAVSSFTRGRLRSWLNLAHFYRDRVAFFHLPSLVIDTDLDGLVTIRGLTFSILDLSIELHGIELGMDLGSGHELSVHSDAIKIELFRKITIDEIYGVHWFTGSSSDPEARNHRADSHTENHLVNTHSPQSKKDTIKEKFFPSVEEAPAANDQDAARDHVLPRTQQEWQETKSEIRSQPHTKARLPSRSDIEAEERYDDVLLKLRQSNRLYQSRARVRIANGKGDHQTDISPETRAAVCADLRNTRPPMSPPSSRIAVSKLISLFEPITRFLDKVPIILRVFLWLLSQSHPVTCPSICFSACGAYLGDELLNKLVRRHTGGDNRIEQLKDEVSYWLSAADIYLDVTRLRGRGSVPLRTTNEIRTEIRSADVFVTRISPKREGVASEEADDNTGRVAQFKGVDSTFHIPTCLLTSHAYLAPLPESSEQEDTAPVFMAVRGSLPAHFSEAFLSFATTLSKTSQMLDIEEEAGRAGRDTDHIVPCSNHPEEQHGHNDTSHSHEGHGKALHGFRSKVAHGKIGAALKHPVQHGKQVLHKEVKKTAVDKVDGAWFAKWTNKLLEKLEGLDGDFGYSTEIQTPITR